MDAEPINCADEEGWMLGAVMCDPGRFAKIQHLSPCDFYHWRHRRIYEAMQTLVSENALPGFQEVRALLKQQGDLERIGATYLTSTFTVHCLYEIERFCELIIEAYRKREAVKAVQRFDEHINEGMAAAEANQILRAKLDEIENYKRKKTKTGVADLLAEAQADLEYRIDNPDDCGLLTGFAQIDAILDGLPKTSFTVLGGRPGMCKTSFALNIAAKVCEAKKRVVFFSLEMSKLELMHRMIARVGNIDAKRLKRPGNHFDTKGWSDYGYAQGVMQGWKLDLFDVSEKILTVDDIASQVRQMDEPPDLIIIDYIQLMDVPPSERAAMKSTEEYPSVTINSKALKRLTRRLSIPVLALSQLSREVEARKNKRPMASDLRGSGSLEQDADHVLLVYRDELYNPETTLRGITEVIVGKNRHGEMGTAPLIFKGSTQAFEDAPHVVLPRLASIASTKNKYAS